LGGFFRSEGSFQILVEAQSSNQAPYNSANFDDIGYGDGGERLVAGVVPLSNDKTKVLVIQSARRGGWVLPKGGWETDERTPQEAARREAWEEAGIECTVQRDLGKIAEMRPANQLSATAPKALYQFYEVSVEREAAQWPEQAKRARQWMSYQQAKVALTTRPELMEALNRSSIVR
jgi:diphosphoinositol-polyphosphate diphosphatase